MKLWFLLLSALGAAACGPAISTGIMKEAGPPADFADLGAHPDTYKGQLVILGGLVMSVQPLNDGSLLMVDQRRLNAQLFPIGDTSGGTFLVESDEWLTSTWYVPKSRVVVAGVVQGTRNGMPLLKAREVKLLAPPVWEKRFYPVPRKWYPPELEYWYTPPYWDPYRNGRRF